MLARNHRLWTDHMTSVTSGGTDCWRRINICGQITGSTYGDLTVGNNSVFVDRSSDVHGRRSATSGEDGQRVCSTSTRFTITP